MRLKSILPIIMLIVISVQAQEPRSSEHDNGTQQSVTNDDGGKAYIIGREPQPFCSSSVGRRTLVPEPQQYSIFLGNNWAQPDLQGREFVLANLLANIRDQSTMTALEDCGLKRLFGPTFHTEKLDQPEGSVTDLQIQKMLAELVSKSTLPRPTVATIYVIFLDAELQSTVGTVIAGKHYAAYHNFFNVSGTRLHYVVVPFAADQQAACQIALRAFVAAALHSPHSISN